MILGGLVVIAASFVLMIRFSVEHKEKEQLLFDQAISERNRMNDDNENTGNSMALGDK